MVASRFPFEGAKSLPPSPNGATKPLPIAGDIDYAETVVHVQFDQELQPANLIPGNWRGLGRRHHWTTNAAQASGDTVTLDIAIGLRSLLSARAVYLASPPDVKGATGLYADAFFNFPLDVLPP